MLRVPRRLAVIALALACLSAGCGDEKAPQTEKTRTTATRTAPPKRAAPLPRAECPPELANCRSASGRIIYVEAVDPDGDGDAHFVLASSQSITGPGITVVDVRRDLRPHPLPGIGEHLSAAGKVLPGSFGQRQIEAVEVRVARRG